MTDDFKAVPLKPEFSRRGFLKGAGVAAATTALESASALARETNSALSTDRVIGPDALAVTLHINGREHATAVANNRCKLSKSLGSALLRPTVLRSSAPHSPIVKG